MPSSIVFDMDGILFDTERIYNALWSTFGDSMGIPDLQEAADQCAGLNYSDIEKYLTNRYGKDFPFDQFMNDISYSLQEKIEREGIPVKTGVYEILDYLRRSKYKIGLATSSSMHSAKGHLIKSDLSDYFDIIVTGDMVSHGKPAPDIYLTACNMLGASPRTTFAVEDSPNGITSAYRAGMRTIMIPDLFAPTQELNDMIYAKFDNLLDFKAYLKDFKE